jgi:Kdo2-lipid IVA lauroyltransferase/acyltransferase
MMLLLKLLARLPLPLLHGLGVVLGWLIYWAPGRHSARMRNNLFESGLCAPGRDCRRLLRQAIGEAGKAIVELLRRVAAPLRQGAEAGQGHQRLGAHRRRARRGQGHHPHLAAYRLLRNHRPVLRAAASVHRHVPAAAPAGAGCADGGRPPARPGDAGAHRPVGRARQLAALKRHETIGMLPDQVATGGDGVWAPFFGRPAYTPTLVASLQRKTGAAAFFVAAERLSWGRGYHLHVAPLDEALPADKTAAAVRINQGVEDVVRRFPAQYMWSYNRYKRPGGVALPDDASAA